MQVRQSRVTLLCSSARCVTGYRWFRPILVSYPVVRFFRLVKQGLGGVRGAVAYALVLTVVSAIVYDHIANSPKAQAV